MHRTFKILAGYAVFIIVSIGSICFSFGQAGTTGAISADSVNIRANPDTRAKILGCLQKDTLITILEQSNGWCKVTYDSATGWIFGQYIKTVSQSSSVAGVITASGVNVRSSSSTDSEVLVVLKNGANVSIIGGTNDWYKIKTQNGTIGWICSKYVSKKGSNIASRGAATTQAAQTMSNVSSSIGSKIVNYGQKFIGVRYVYGGSSPKGFDCSGFVKYVYNNFGYNLERVAAGQATQGVTVKKSNLSPGDLVFFDTDGGKNYINHVGIYIGGGKFIHASSGSSSRRVVTSDLTGGFYANAYMTAKRIIK